MAGLTSINRSPGQQVVIGLNSRRQRLLHFNIRVHPSQERSIASQFADAPDEVRTHLRKVRLGLFPSSAKFFHLLFEFESCGFQLFASDFQFIH